MLAIASDQDVRIHHISSKSGYEVVKRFDNPKGHVYGVKFQNGGQYLAAGADKGLFFFETPSSPTKKGGK